MACAYVAPCLLRRCERNYVKNLVKSKTELLGVQKPGSYGTSEESTLQMSFQEPEMLIQAS